MGSEMNPIDMPKTEPYIWKIWTKALEDYENYEPLLRLFLHQTGGFDPLRPPDASAEAYQV